MLHELLTMERFPPFADMEHPSTYADAGYRAPDGPALADASLLVDTVAGLLCVEPVARLAAAEAAARLEQAVAESATAAAAESARAETAQLVAVAEAEEVVWRTAEEAAAVVAAEDGSWARRVKEEQRRASLTSPAAMSDGEAVLLLQSLTRPPCRPAGPIPLP